MPAKGVLVPIAAMAAIILCVLAGCGREASSLYADDSTLAKAPVIPAQNYIGRWAVTSANCAGQPWTFQASSLAAGDGTICHIASAQQSPAGYSLPGVCRRPDGELPGRLLLTFAGVDSMTLTGGPYKQPVTLVRCIAQE